MNEYKRQAWVARDKDGALWIYGDAKPYKVNSYNNWVSDGNLMEPINPDLFPSVKWEDEEPTEVEITIKLKKK